MVTGQTIKTFREAPPGVRVVQAFSKQQAYCEGNFDQVRTVPAGSWVDLGIEWDAIDAETVEATWPYLTIAISVDGEEIENPKQHSKGPYKAVLECPNETHVGYAMANALYAPPLSIGDHKVVWTVGFARDVNDGWSTYPKGKVVVATSTLHVVEPS